MTDINLDYYLLEVNNKFISPIPIEDYEANLKPPILQKVQEITTLLFILLLDLLTLKSM